MMSFDVRTTVPDTIRRLNDLQRDQLPFAHALALTSTAKRIQPEEVREMERVFDRPTRFTLGALFVIPATKRNLVARLHFKDDPTDGGAPAAKYLFPQVHGGTRDHKRFERLLIHHGLMEPEMYAVPGEAAELDASGNISRGQLVRILSQLRVQGAAGFESRLSVDRKKAARSRRRQGFTIFAHRPWASGFPGSASPLPPGIYARYQFASGTAVKPLVIFVRRTPQYRKRLHFYEFALERAARYYPGEFSKAYRRAVATARSR